MVIYKGGNLKSILARFFGSAINSYSQECQLSNLINMSEKQTASQERTVYKHGNSLLFSVIGFPSRNKPLITPKIFTMQLLLVQTYKNIRAQRLANIHGIRYSSWFAQVCRL